jgi:carotenoid cleavage dioxygenase-like enzyme
MFVELDTRQNDGLTVSLEWDRDTGNTQVVVYDSRAASEVVFGVARAEAADAFRHPFRYQPE